MKMKTNSFATFCLENLKATRLLVVHSGAGLIKQKKLILCFITIHAKIKSNQANNLELVRI